MRPIALFSRNCERLVCRKLPIIVANRTIFSGLYTGDRPYLLSQVADPFALNRGKDSVLHDAAGSGNLALVRQLLSLGSNIDLPNHNNETPLNEATQTGKLAVVKLLLERGADPKVRSRFGTPLMLVIERDNQPMIDLVKQNNQGQTRMALT